MSKVDKRRQAIHELIHIYEVQDQQQLLALMEQEYGIITSQSIISRDLRALGVGKRVDKDKTYYALPKQDVRQEILRLAVTAVQYNESLISITTVPGLADFVGDYLDSCNHPAILSTLAGENVVWVAPKTVRSLTRTVDVVRSLLFVKEK